MFEQPQTTKATKNLLSSSHKNNFIIRQNKSRAHKNRAKLAGTALGEEIKDDGIIEHKRNTMPTNLNYKMS